MSDKQSENHDPWTNRPQKEGPPELDVIISKLYQKIRTLFGNKGTISQKQLPKGFNHIVAIAISTVIILIWLLSGFFIVSPAEQAAILRFGKYVRAEEPGLHWVPPFIEARKIVNTQSISNFPYSAEMLTKDENIVSVAIAVQYRIDNIHDYLFNAVQPEISLQQATASALRQVIGHTTLDDILTTGREQVRQQAQQLLIEILNNYHTGIKITDFTLQPAKPPEAVTEAFDDVNKAREDEQRYINSAKAYQEKVVPIAQGQAKRIIQEAEAYQQQVTLKAKANTAQFLALLPQYNIAPEVTRERMYLTTIETVLKNSSKILVDIKNNNNLLYLPIDKLIANNSPTPTKPQTNGDSDTINTTLNESISTTPENLRPNRVGYTDGGSY